RYTEQAGEQAVGFEIIEHKQSIIKEIADQIKQRSLKNVGFEQDDLTYSVYQQYDKLIDANLIATSNIVEQIRMIKTDEELEIMYKAAEIADLAYDHILKTVEPGMTEIEISNMLEFEMRKHGATSSSFDTIVASGYRSALPHGVASDKKVQEGELVT